MILSSACCTPSPRDVAGDAGVVALAADLVDLVDVDDAALRPLDVVVGVLEQLDDDVLDVLADVAGFGQRRRVGDGEGDVQDLGERLREERLAGARRAEEQDVRLRELDVVGGRRASRCACSGCAPRPRGSSSRGPGRSRSRRGSILISEGLGTGVEPAYGSSFSTSSAMMSLQSPMHSSQM